MNLIEVKEITKVFKIKKKVRIWQKKQENFFALNKINFSVKEGELVGLIGSNGAGKSTLIKILSGILHPTSGIVNVKGIVPYLDRVKYVQNIGVVFGGKTQLIREIQFFDALKIHSKIYQQSRNEFEKNLTFFEEHLQIKELYKKPILKMSLGQKMKAELVAAFLHNPKIVFLDEPTLGLDAVAKIQVRTLIAKLVELKKTTIILTTHDFEDIESLAKRIIILDKGVKIYDGSTFDLKQKYNQVKYMIVDLNDISQENAQTLEKQAEKCNIKIKVEQLEALQYQVRYKVSECKDQEVLNFIFKIFDHKIHNIDMLGDPLEEIVRSIYEQV